MPTTVIRTTQINLHRRLEIVAHRNLGTISDIYPLKIFNLITVSNRGHEVAQLVEALRYKSEGRGFDSRLCH